MDTGGRTAAERASSQAPAVPFADCWISPNARTAAQRVLESGWVSSGREVLEFESEFADFVGANCAVAVQSCTSGLELALRSLRLRPKSRVLVSSLTFCGAVHAILQAGLEPVLVDVDPGTGMPSMATTYDAAQSCSGAVAMIVTHLGGDPTNVEAMAAAADIRLERVVEDAAHALGTDVEGRRVGSIAGATCFSFHASANVPIGAGGMITTPDRGRAEWLRRARLHGMSSDGWRRYLPGSSWRYDVAEAGLKADMTDLQAAIGRAQLAHFAEWQGRRAEIAAEYDRLLAATPGLGLPHRPSRAENGHSWLHYTVCIRPEFPLRRDEVLARLATQTIGTTVHFVPVHHLSYFRRVVRIPSGGLLGTEALFPQLLSLPIYPRLSDDAVRRVAEALVEMSSRTPRESRP
jgi:dTDP-4-amino-4,6-dideoxygalactose transaminase